jgi:hypothetical protein
MLSVIMSSVIMLNVAAPLAQLHCVTVRNVEVSNQANDEGQGSQGTTTLSRTTVNVTALTITAQFSQSA